MQIAGTQNLGDRSIFDELVARAAAASPTNGGGPTWPASPAYAHRIFLMKLYAKEYWWSIAGFIGVLVVLNLVGHVHTYFTLRSVKTSPSPFSDAERAAAARPLRRPLSPFPVRVCRSARALLNIALFRTVPPLRPLHNFSNVSEALVVGAYIGATIAWALMGTPDVNRPNVSNSLQNLFCQWRRLLTVALFSCSSVNRRRIGLPKLVIIRCPR